MPARERFLNLADFEPVARRRLPHCFYSYIAGGVEDNQARAANRAAFARLAFRPRMLVDTSERDCQVEAFGKTWAAPFGIAPMGMVGLSAYRGDLALARAAARANIPFMLSGSSLVSLERIIAANPEAWFQMYPSPRMDDNERLLQRLVAAGYHNLVVTLDVPVPGNRESDLRNGFSSPLRITPRLALDGLLHPRWLAGTFARTLLTEGMPHFENYAQGRAPMLATSGVRPHRRDSMTWAALRRIRDLWPHRMVVKGVLAVEDVRPALAAGADAIQVSNHGGRQLDVSVAPLTVLPDIVAAAGDAPVLYDSGIRRGSDVLKAIALGATQVFLGRPFMFAAVAGGEDGVVHAIDLLRREILSAQALLGVPRPTRAALAPQLIADSARASG